MAERLPRVGGDGPDDRAEGDERPRAPPRGRGWTRSDSGGIEERGGSPAWAGMDPSMKGSLRSPSGLPRVGGDGPRALPLHEWVTQAPPRGRGWTPCHRRPCPWCVGSPAWAGMDPSSGPESRSPTGLPRVGGDGPPPWIPSRAAVGAPPRGRGWTHHLLPRVTSDRGSPAWAGMDPPPPCATTDLRWLPRVGGDGPGGHRRKSELVAAPPRGRGWTLEAREVHAAAAGSPAWAGMDPFASLTSPRTWRLPRVGGDGPFGPARTVTLGAAPPRGRGWTPVTHVADEFGEGSPAWAGMDPRRSRPRPTLPRLPRVGGDGPFDGVTKAAVTEAPPRGRGWTRCAPTPSPSSGGSPAWAGMDPPTPSRCCAARWLPRVGGDGPCTKRASPGTDWAPPRGRGWTRHDSRCCGRYRGSPAWAGMDPRSPRRRRPSRRLPRVGGDGPSTRRSMGITFRAPPRGRGWTRRRPHGAARLAGSPAWAGMDPSRDIVRALPSRLPRVGGDGP